MVTRLTKRLTGHLEFKTEVAKSLAWWVFCVRFHYMPMFSSLHYQIPFFSSSLHNLAHWPGPIQYCS